MIHPFICPEYVLDSCLSDGGKTPKWDPCLELGVYLGLFPNHASNVGLIFSPNTRHISPQYHVVHYNNFTSITAFVLQSWPQLFKNLFNTSCSKSPDDFADLDADDIFVIPRGNFASLFHHTGNSFLVTFFLFFSLVRGRH